MPGNECPEILEEYPGQEGQIGAMVSLGPLPCPVHWPQALTAGLGAQDRVGGLDSSSWNLEKGTGIPLMPRGPGQCPGLAVWLRLPSGGAEGDTIQAGAGLQGAL